MRRPLFASFATAAGALAAAMALAPLTVTAQAPAVKAKAVPAKAKAYVPPKTPWGDPDLQGVWPGNMGVPMQRPQAMGTRTTDRKSVV